MSRVPVIPTASTIALCATFAAPGFVFAEVGMGPAVHVTVPPNTPLTRSLRVTVVTDEPSAVEDVTIAAYLRVGGRSLGSVGRLAVHATDRPSSVILPVPSSLRDKARSVGRSTGHARGTLVFTTTGAVGSWAQESFVSLRAPIPTNGPTRIAVKGNVAGAAHSVARGWVTLATPRGWLRTSVPNATLATFHALPVTDGCRASAYAQPAPTAARSITSALGADHGPGPIVRRGRTGQVTWRVHATGAEERLPNIAAFGIRQIAPRRYLALRVHVSLEPGCPASATRVTALLSELQHAVSHMTAAARVTSTRAR